MTRQAGRVRPYRHFKPLLCECADPLCPKRHGYDCHADATIILYRVDMTDETGTAMCETCSVDALESGLFTDGEDNGN